MSTFVSIFVEEVTGKTQLPATHQQQPQGFVSSTNSERKQKLQDVSLELNPPVTEQSIVAALILLRDAAAPSGDPEEEVLKQAILGRVVLAVYADALRTYLDQATEAEREAEWWDNVERSRYELAWYLLQSKSFGYPPLIPTAPNLFVALPVRLLDLFRTVTNALRQHNIPITLSSFKLASVRQVLPTSVDGLHYNVLTKAMFPHLCRYPLPSLLVAPVRLQPRSRPKHALVYLRDNLLRWHHIILSTITLPIDLARQECQLKRQELERIRDERAEALGSLSEMRLSLQDNFDTYARPSYGAADLGIERYSPLIDMLQLKLDGKPAHLGIRPGSVERLLELSVKVLPGHKMKNLAIFAEGKLKRPSGLVLAWPKLILGPPLLFYGFKLLYTSRTSLREVVEDAWSTLLGLWRGWLIDPLKDVLRTVRAGSEGSIIVQKEAVSADLAVSESTTFPCNRAFLT